MYWFFNMTNEQCYQIINGWQILSKCKIDQSILMWQSRRNIFIWTFCSQKSNKPSSLVWFGWQITFKDYHLLDFDIELTSYINNYLKRLLKYSCLFHIHICVRPSCLQILQPKQHVATDGMQQIWESNCVVLN